MLSCVHAHRSSHALMYYNTQLLRPLTPVMLPDVVARPLPVKLSPGSVGRLLINLCALALALLQPCRVPTGYAAHRIRGKRHQQTNSEQDHKIIHEFPHGRTYQARQYNYTRYTRLRKQTMDDGRWTIFRTNPNI